MPPDVNVPGSKNHLTIHASDPFAFMLLAPWMLRRREPVASFASGWIGGSGGCGSVGGQRMADAHAARLRTPPETTSARVKRG